MAMSSHSSSLPTVRGRSFRELIRSPEIPWEGLVSESECFLEDYGGYVLSISAQPTDADGSVDVLFTLERTDCALIAPSIIVRLAFLPTLWTL